MSGKLKFLLNAVEPGRAPTRYYLLLLASIATTMRLAMYNNRTVTTFLGVARQ